MFPDIHVNPSLYYAFRFALMWLKFQSSRIALSFLLLQRASIRTVGVLKLNQRPFAGRSPFRVWLRDMYHPPPVLRTQFVQSQSSKNILLPVFWIVFVESYTLHTLLVSWRHDFPLTEKFLEGRSKGGFWETPLAWQQRTAFWTESGVRTCDAPCPSIALTGRSQGLDGEIRWGTVPL